MEKLLSKIFKTFSELSGITGYNIIVIFLISSRATYIIVFNLIIIIFMTQNSVERVDIHFINYSFQNSYLNVVLLFTLLFGVISGFMTSVFVIISNKAKIKSLQNKNRILTEELNDLRNVAIDEGIYESDDGDY